MVDGLLNMRSRPYLSENLFDIPVDEGTRGMILPVGKRGGQRSVAFPQMALDAYQSLLTPYKAYSGELGMPSVDNPAFTDAATRFSVDFGLLPALGTAAIAKQSPNVLRMGMGGADTVSGGAVRGPEVDELGFYSQALETAKNLQQAKGTGEQFRKMLLSAGVKPDEIKFTPELEGLLSQPKITRDEVVGLLQENRIRPEQTMLRSSGDGAEEELYFGNRRVLPPEEAFGPDYILEEAHRYLYDDFDSYKTEVQSQLVKNGTDEDEAKRMVDAYEEGGESALGSRDFGFMEEAAEDIFKDSYQYDDFLRQEEYRDPDTGYAIIGNDEYGWLVKNPDGNVIRTDGDINSFQEATVAAQVDAYDNGILGGAGNTRFMNSTEDGGTNYREMLLQVPKYEGMTDEFIATGHYDEPNIAVHARTKDRSSDTGVNDVLYVEELQSDWGQRGRNRGFDTPKDRAKIEEIRKEEAKFFEVHDEANTRFDDFQKEEGAKLAKILGGEYEHSSNRVYDADGKRLLSGVNVNMYLDGEHILATNAKGEEVILKAPKGVGKKHREVKDARKKAYDEYLPYYKQSKMFTAEIPVGPFVGNSDKFAELGVKRLINQAAQEGKRYLSFSTGDIQADRWNEEGLKTFYDKIIPKAVEKVAKRLDKDASVTDEFYIDDVDGPRFTIEITPKMREKALEGQPLFNAPVAPLPATSLLGEDKPAMSPEQMYQAGII